MPYIVTKTPADQNVSEAETAEFIAELLDERGQAVTLTHRATVTQGDWHVFIFSIGSDELSECDDMLSELVSMPRGLRDGFATLVLTLM